MKTHLTLGSIAVIVLSALASHPLPVRAQDASVEKAGGFTVGCAAYTFRQGTAFEAIDRTKACGGKVIEFFAWQKLSAETGDVKLDENLSAENIHKLKDKLKAAGIRAVNCYVGNQNFAAGSQDESGPRKMFEFARKLGLRGLTGEPPADQLDIIEKLVKEYDIQFCIHNHRKEATKPEYRNWDPSYVLSLVKNRDRRIGACADTGHYVRSNLKPAEAIKILGNRVMSLHLKDPKDWTPDAQDQPFGTGVADIKAVLAELKNVRFKGHIAVEYETQSAHLLDDVKHCIEYVRREGEKLPGRQKKD